MAATIWTGSRRANGGARRVGIVGLAVLAAIALGADPVANAASVSGERALAPDTTATNAMSGETPAPPPAPSGITGGGGALPVLPATGGCIIGLNCGCIGRLCPGPQPHHHPTLTNGQPNYAPAVPRPGPSGGV
jgi:hypothetical protein